MGHLGTYGPHFPKIWVLHKHRPSFRCSYLVQFSPELRHIWYLISVSLSVPCLSSAYLSFLRTLHQAAPLRLSLVQAFHVSTHKWMQYCTNTIALWQIPKCWRSAVSNALSVYMLGFALAPLGKKIQGLGVKFQRERNDTDSVFDAQIIFLWIYRTVPGLNQLASSRGIEW